MSGVSYSGPPPFCPRCKHYFITWDPAFPKGCRLFNIKSKQLPSFEVRAANQRDCPAYEAKPG
ncbi:MAG: uracil-DNA glycosylase [Spirochaetes bacterium]|nr:MAG: uracil-DNA glycosylase [Spirochaetota bacterium]